MTSREVGLGPPLGPARASRPGASAPSRPCSTRPRRSSPSRGWRPPPSPRWRSGPGTSIGAVYHHFRDKKALLYALYDRLAESFEATAADAVDPARWEGASVGDILQGYLEFSLASERERPGFQAGRPRGLPARPGPRRPLREAQGRARTAGLTDLILARADEIGHPDPKLATAFVLDQFAAMLRPRLHGIDRQHPARPSALRPGLRGRGDAFGLRLPPDRRLELPPCVTTADPANPDPGAPNGLGGQRAAARRPRTGSRPATRRFATVEADGISPRYAELARSVAGHDLGPAVPGRACPPPASSPTCCSLRSDPSPASPMAPPSSWPSSPDGTSGSGSAGSCGAGSTR